MVTARPRGGTGDVKYHQGAQGDYVTAEGKEIARHARLQPEPPRVRRPGGARAARAPTRPTAPGPRSSTGPRARAADPDPRRRRLPGRGRGRRRRSTSRALDGYSTGGVIHIIANNQIGFTTEPEESRSTRYASDLAKGFDMPIIHVNADDPEACISAVRLAMAYREEFKRGRRDRPDRLPPLRPQRDRRARLHAAADVREDQEPPAGAQALRGRSWSSRGSSRRTRRSGC